MLKVVISVWLGEIHRFRSREAAEEEIYHRGCQSVLEPIDPEHGFEVVGGMEGDSL
jgi:hypothetical protein